MPVMFLTTVLFTVILCATPKRPLFLRVSPPYFSTKLKTRVTEVMVIKRPYFYVKVKVKVHPRTGHEGPKGDYRYRCNLSLTSALDVGGWSTPRPGRLTPGNKTGYPVYRRLGGPHGRSGRVRKISPPQGFDTRTVQPVASRYTNWAIPVHPYLYVHYFI